VACLRICPAILTATLAISAQSPSLVITGVNIVDVAAGRIVPDSTVTIGGQTITSIARTGVPPKRDRVIDGRGKFLIPGLWDMHAHIQGSEAGWLPLNLANGVTGIRDMGADLDRILATREATASGRVLGPRIVAAGPILDDPPRDWPLRMRVKTAEQARAAVRLLKERGVDLVKVHNFTPRDAFFAIADEARRQGLTFAGHVPLEVTIEEGVEAGISSIEHFSEGGRVWKACSGGGEYRREQCRPFFETLARRGVWQTPTLLAMSEGYGGILGTPASAVPAGQYALANAALRKLWAENQATFAEKPEVLRAIQAQAETAKLVTSDMAKAGVGILAGCDALIAGFCVHDELGKMVDGGMSPLAALQAATLNPARYLRIDGTTGTVADGKRADLVLLDANPLEDIANVRRIRAVVAAGKMLDRPRLDQLLAEAKTAARQ
jgi:imidazolonepropionase-like amidohydrolase